METVAMSPQNEKLADDILDGAKEIADYIRILNERQVYHYQEALGLKHLRGKLIGFKSEITKRLKEGLAA
jgi:hypothetical protein